MGKKNNSSENNKGINLPEDEKSTLRGYTSIIENLTLEEHIFYWVLIFYPLDSPDYISNISVKYIQQAFETIQKKDDIIKINNNLWEIKSSWCLVERNFFRKLHIYFNHLYYMKLEEHLWYWFLVHYDRTEIDWYTTISTQIVFKTCTLSAKKQGIQNVDLSWISDNSDNYKDIV